MKLRQSWCALSSKFFMLVISLILTQAVRAAEFPWFSVQQVTSGKMQEEIIEYEEITSYQSFSNADRPQAVLVNINPTYDPHSMFLNKHAQYPQDLYSILHNINKGIDKPSRKIDIIVLGNDDAIAAFAKEVRHDLHLSFDQEIPNLKVVNTTDTATYLQDPAEFVQCTQKGEGQSRPAILGINYHGIDSFVQLSKHLQCPMVGAGIDGSTGDKGGNLESTPDQLLLYGDTLSEFSRVLDRFQETKVKLNASWLSVGHVDEMVSVFPSTHQCIYRSDYRGPTINYSIMWASPLKAVELILQSNGNEIFGESEKQTTYFQEETFRLALNFFLKSDADMSKLSLESFQRNASSLENCQKALDGARKKYCLWIELNLNAETIMQENIDLIKQASPCLNLDLIPMPVLYASSSSSYANHESSDLFALLPSQINSLILNDHIVMPDPHYTPFKKYALTALKDRLDSSESEDQSKIHFIDDRYLHRGHGNIHCGTQTLRTVALE